MEYEYSPISQRPPLKWPDGKRVALVITLALETWDLVKDSDEPHYAGGPPITPDPLPGKVPDFPNYTWREYGQRVGVWRLFDVMDRYGVKLSCPVNALTCERRVEMVQGAIERGHELVAHNYEQGELLTNFAHDPDRERDVIARTLKAYEKTVGRPSRGWLSSSLRGTLNTAGILAESGMLYYCDLLNDDQPYMLQTGHGPIVAVPYSNEINDFTLVTRRGHTTDEFRDILIEELDVLYEESAESGRLMNVGLHPHVSGRAYRVRGIAEFIEHAKSLDGVWWATREEIAQCYLDQQPGSTS